MNYGDMDILDITRELRKLLEKYSKGERMKKEEIEQMRVLSNNFSCECSHVLYDWGK